MRSVVIRPARLDDASDLWPMVDAYLREIKQYGSEIEPTQRTLEFFVAAAIGEDVIANTVCFVAESEGGLEGFVMATEFDLPYDHDMGKFAHSWGTYVRPDSRGQGLSSSLRHELRCALRKQGFNTIVGAAHDTNTAGLESALKTAKKTQTLIRVNLDSGEQE